MGDVRNCPSCNDLFNYIGTRDVCGKCATKEEELYQIVYRFLRKRENRAATIERICEATGVSDTLIHKWVRKKRLLPTMFPNLGYPCDQCGHLTYGAKLCEKCVETLQRDLRMSEAAKEFRENVERSNRGTYLAQRKQ